MKYPPKHNTPYQTLNDSDEIDLMELFHALKQHILLIISITALFSCLAVLYAVTATPTFKSEAIISETSLSNLQTLDNGINLIETTPEDELTRLYYKLVNQDLQYQFFKNNVYDASPANPVSPLQAYESFNKNLVVSRSKMNKGEHNFLNISYSSNTAQASQKVLTDYINWINQIASKDLSDHYKATIQTHSVQLESELSEKLEAVNQNIAGELARLKEAADMARTLNIKSSDSNALLNGFNFSSEATIHSLPLYALGYNVLETRIKTLQNRSGAANLTPEITELQSKLKTLHRVKLNNETIQLFRYEKSPIIPHAPIKPKKALIAILGTLLGMMLGCLIALIRYFTKKRPETIEQDVEATDNEFKEPVSFLNKAIKTSNKNTSTPA